MPRLQFSIRALLVLMTLVGVGIVVFRWPWTVTEEQPNGTVVTAQFHRAWNGKAVKHGLSVINYPHTPDFYWEHWYYEGDLRRQRATQNKVVFWDKATLNGVLHGPSFTRDGTTTVHGSHHLGKQHGAWQQSDAEVIRDETWRMGIRHGPWKWSTPPGRVLQSAEYEDGKLIAWNGRPVAEAVREWLAANIPDAELQQRLQRRIAPQKNWRESLILSYGQVIYFVEPQEYLDIQWDLDKPPEHVPPHDRPIGEAILEHALAHDRTLAYRFQVLHFVPITPQQLTWQDRTGVHNIRFEPGSEQESFWLQPARFSPWYLDNPAARLKKMFEYEEGLVRIDTTAIDNLEQPYSSPRGDTLPALPRIRRDLIGQHLDREGYYCELREGTLVIKPHPGERLQRKQVAVEVEELDWRAPTNRRTGPLTESDGLRIDPK